MILTIKFCLYRTKRKKSLHRQDNEDNSCQNIPYISHYSSFTTLFFSRVMGQASQGVLSFSEVKKVSADELIMWVEGYLSLKNPPPSPTRLNLIHLCPHTLCSDPKNVKGEQEKHFSKECKNLLKIKK